MRIFLTLILTFMIICPAGNAALAQSDARLTESLNFLNRSKPLQNPQFDHSQEVLDHHILDRRNRVVGEVDDILLTKNGDVSALSVELDRLRIRDKILLNYSEMRIRDISDAYALNMDDDQIEELLPTLLNSIETASGESADVYSLKKLKGARLIAEDGRRLGTVSEILFEDNSPRAQALYVNLKYKTIRDELAIPFSITQPVQKGSALEVILKNAQADAILEYARER
ncbi:MAG: PRC-barrel domain-containing protein [Alphaproteobacteria bacterium]|nr:PRC-barrel domain-containing protein [Alphaproteobacteria bacterium]